MQVNQWCVYHKDDPIPQVRKRMEESESGQSCRQEIESIIDRLQDDTDNREKRTDDIPSWDVEFLKVR